jgi:hypothetical protein
MNAPVPVRITDDFPCQESLRGQVGFLTRTWADPVSRLSLRERSGCVRFIEGSYAGDSVCLHKRYMEKLS